MADRRDYFYLQKLTEAELDAGFEGVEQSIFNIAKDYSLYGITSGLEVSESAVPAITVDINNGVAYSNLGERIEIESPLADVDVSQDDGAISTAVSSPGNEKYISVFLEFDRLLSDPRTDGNGFVVYHIREESYQISIVQGSEAPLGTAGKPPLDSDKVLLADVRLIFGQTEILDANIDTDRRQFSVNVESTNGLQVKSGNAEDGIADVLEKLDEHINTVVLGGAHQASSVLKQAGPGWADGTTQPADNLEDWINKMVLDLTSSATKRGMGKITSPAMANWADGTPIPANNAADQLTQIINNLRSITGSTGSHKIGIDALNNTHFTLAAGDLHTFLNDALNSIDSNVAFIADNITWPGVHDFNGNVDFNSLTEVTSGAKLDILSGGIFEISAGAQGNIFGNVDYESGSVLSLNSGSSFECISEARFHTSVKFLGGVDVDFDPGSVITFENGSALGFTSGSSTVFAAGSNLDFEGVANFENGATLFFDSGSKLDMTGGSELEISSGAQFSCDGSADFSSNIDFESGTNADFESGSSLELLAGSTFFARDGANVTFQGTTNFSSTSEAEFQSGSVLHVQSGSLLDCDAQAQFNAFVKFLNGVDVDFDSGSQTNFESGSSLVFDDGSGVKSLTTVDFRNGSSFLQYIPLLIGQSETDGVTGDARHGILFFTDTGEPTDYLPNKLYRYNVPKAWCYIDNRLQGSGGSAILRESFGIDSIVSSGPSNYVTVNFKSGLSFPDVQSYAVAACVDCGLDINNLDDVNFPASIKIKRNTVSPFGFTFAWIDQNGNDYNIGVEGGTANDYVGASFVIFGDG